MSRAKVHGGSSKKPLWKSCEKCGCIFSVRDAASHSCDGESVTWEHGYIKDKVLFGTLILLEEVKANVPEEKKEDLVFLPQSVLQVCEFMIGSFVEIVLPDGEKILKEVWPIAEGSLTNVSILKSGIDYLLSKKTKSGLLQVRHMESKPSIAKEVAFKFCSQIVDPSSFSEFLEYSQRRKIVFVGAKLKVHFAGREIIIQVESCKRVNSQSDIDLELLSLKEGYYLCNEDTRWKPPVTKTMQEAEPPKKIGGYASIVEELENYIKASTSKSNVDQNCLGVLLYGPHGCGKTYMAQAVAERSQSYSVFVQAGSLVAGSSKEMENQLKSLVNKAIENSPSILILDNVDLLCPVKGSDQDRRITATVFNLFDSLQMSRVVVFATSSKPDEIDPGLRRPGRLEREIEIDPPEPADRFQILTTFCPDERLAEVFLSLSNLTHGFVAADLLSLWNKANLKAALRNESVSPDDLIWALKQVKPSAMRQVSLQSPGIHWDDIGGMDELKLKLKQAVEWPLKHPDSFKRLGITPPSGVLMFGPPGCSKTMIAKAVATESNLNFLSVKGSDIFSKWVGESEKAVRDLFKKARAVAPSIIFLDEVDALGAERDSKPGDSGGSAVRERVLSQLLTEMDGVHALKNVIIIAATNRPDRIDKALLRPGRLDRMLYVPLPDDGTRLRIFQLQRAKMPVDPSVDLEELVSCTNGHSGAEIVAICREAALKALEESMDASVVNRQHFISALETVRPRTPKYLLELYAKYIN